MYNTIYCCYFSSLFLSKFDLIAILYLTHLVLYFRSNFKNIFLGLVKFTFEFIKGENFHAIKLQSREI